MALMSKVARFVEAAKHSPVVMGEVLNREQRGARYILENGSIHELTREECIEAAELAGGMPRWKSPTEENTRA